MSTQCVLMRMLMNVHIHTLMHIRNRVRSFVYGLGAHSAGHTLSWVCA